MKPAPRVLRVLRVALLVTLVAVPAAAAPSGSHPLLDLAQERERGRDQPATSVPDDSGVRQAQHVLDQAHPPADADCPNSIGASRFARLHIELAVAYTAVGDFRGAANAYRHAHACRPRDADVLAALAGVLFDARDLVGTRAALTASLAIDPRSVSSNRLAGNLEFVEEHWAEAIARFRYVASSDEDRVQAGYGQLMFWLAQKRAGVARPEFIQRTRGEGWPQPLLLYMEGKYTESELIAPIEEGDSSENSQPNTSTDERLCEALYYVGEDYWARGQPEVARDYFTALVNIRVLYFLEHGLAIAEIAKLK